MAGGVAPVAADGSPLRQPVHPVRLATAASLSDTIVEACAGAPTTIEDVLAGDRRSLARTITAVEGGPDELVRGVREDQLRIAVLAADPTRRRAGGALRHPDGLPGGHGGALTPVETQVSTGVTTVVPPARARRRPSEESGVAPSPAAEPVAALLQRPEAAPAGTQVLCDVGGHRRHV